MVGPPSFSLLECHTAGLLVLLHPGHSDHTDPKGRFVSFKVTPFNARRLCAYAPSEHSNRKELTKGHFFEGLQNYMENKNMGNENNIILGDFNRTMDKMDRDGGNKIQRIYRCRSNYELS